jgi:anti-sigma regulatory factor (Ser/Thr protein kinase)
LTVGLVFPFSILRRFGLSHPSWVLDERGKTLSFIVKDEGPGFDYINLPDPTAPENLEKSHGRGVFLIMQLADMVVFSDNGATLEMLFKV